MHLVVSRPHSNPNFSTTSISLISTKHPVSKYISGTYIIHVPILWHFICIHHYKWCMEYSTRGGLEWQIRHETKLSAVFDIRPTTKYCTFHISWVNRTFIWSLCRIAQHKLWASWQVYTRLWCLWSLKGVCSNVM